MVIETWLFNSAIDFLVLLLSGLLGRLAGYCVSCRGTAHRASL